MLRSFMIYLRDIEIISDILFKMTLLHSIKIIETYNFMKSIRKIVPLFGSSMKDKNNYKC